MKRVINFSGGKTSALMTILLRPTPEDIVLFCDTGREHPKTYKFINDFEAFEGIEVHRISYTHKKSPGLTGFDANVGYGLYPFQKFVVERALRAGKYAVFGDCGTGKTRMQGAWANEVVNHTNRPVLILAPLAVTGQSILDCQNIGVNLIELSENTSGNLVPAIYITNYEQMDNISPDRFAGIALDESSILKNFDGAFRNKIISLFATTPYKTAWTATPSPNDDMELGNHAEFLNVMPRNEMLAMYFNHNGGDTSKWYLKGHAKEKFYDWMSTWAIMFSTPHDLGFEQSGYDLPPLNMVEKQIATEKRNNWALFNDVAVSATNFNHELRLTRIERLNQVAEIVNASTEQFIIWIKHDDEGKELRSMIPGAIEVSGSDKKEVKKDRLLGFGKNEFRVLITKAKIAQFGLNYQNCHNQVFASLDFSFESLYQSIRRSYRFGQKQSVNIYLITTDTMTNVIAAIYEKQAQFLTMQAAMKKAILRNLNIEVPTLYMGSVKMKLPNFLKSAA